MARSIFAASLVMTFVVSFAHGHFPRIVPTRSIPTRSSITVLEDGVVGDRDVVILPKNTDTGSLMFGHGVNADAGLVGSVVLNEYSDYDDCQPLVGYVGTPVERIAPPPILPLRLPSR